MFSINKMIFMIGLLFADCCGVFSFTMFGRTFGKGPKPAAKTKVVHVKPKRAFTDLEAEMRRSDDSESPFSPRSSGSSHEVEEPRRGASHTRVAPHDGYVIPAARKPFVRVQETGPLKSHEFAVYKKSVKQDAQDHARQAQIHQQKNNERAYNRSMAGHFLKVGDYHMLAAGEARTKKQPAEAEGHEAKARAAYNQAKIHSDEADALAPR